MPGAAPVELISQKPDGGAANGNSNGAVASADGRCVAFYSDATNIVPLDNNGYTDVFVYDRESHASTLVSVGANGEVKYQLEVPNGASNLLFAMYGGTGDADMYVKYGTPPTNTSYNCRPYAFGNNETCFFPTPQAGTWYVTLKGYTAAAGVSLYPSFVDANYPYKQAATVEQLTNHRTRVTLTWQHGKKQVDIYRNGLIYNSRRNTYTFTDNFRIVGSGTMTYKICNQGTAECSNEVSVDYASKK